MAQRFLVQFVDDLDGTAAEDVETVQFGLDGVTYLIDLNARNADSLRTALRDFIANARRTGGRAGRSTATRTTPGGPRTRKQTQLIREWARENGYELADRGRIPARVIDDFEEAHG
ncbi:histone-like nucleoid-structuring protein Lsr2 [Lentzea xinjiangensis]|nr:Lsr2 family protein [Lentzea xinjiangensis]